MMGPSRLIHDYRETWRGTGASGRRFLIGTAIYAMRLQAFFVAFPLFLKERGFTSGEIGLITSGNWAAELLFGIPVIWLGLRGWSRQALAIGPMLSGIGLLLTVVHQTHDVAVLFMYSVAAGIGGTTFWILGDPLLASTSSPSQRPRLFALKFCFLTGAMSLGGGIGGWIPGGLEAFANVADERALGITLVVLALLDLLLGVVFRSFPKSGVQASRDHEQLAQRSQDETSAPKGRRWMWLLVLVLVAPQIGMAVGGNSIKPFLSLFLGGRYDLSTGATGTVMALMSGVGGLGALLMPGIAARVGSIRLIAGFRFMGAVLVGLWFTTTGLLPLLPLLCLYVIMTDGTEATYIAGVMNRLPGQWRTIFSGAFAMLWSAASVFAATLSGVLQDRQDGAFGLAFSVGMAGYLFSAVWVAVVFPRLPRLAVEQARPAGGVVPEDDLAIARQ